MRHLLTEITLCLTDVQDAVHQWLREQPNLMPVADLVVNRDQSDLLSCTARHYIDGGTMELLVRQYVERETGLVAVGLKWKLDTIGSSRQVVGCTVQCEQPRPPRDIIPLPPRSFPGFAAQRAIDEARASANSAPVRAAPPEEASHSGAEPAETP